MNDRKIQSEYLHSGIQMCKELNKLNPNIIKMIEIDNSGKATLKAQYLDQIPLEIISAMSTADKVQAIAGEIRFDSLS